MNKNVFLYVRVSTTNQAEEGYSIEEQIDRLKSFCKSKDWNILHTYIDPGYSGSNTQRPALQEMLKDLKPKKADAVLVYKLDRLSRSQKDTLMLIEDCFLKNNVDFVSLSENFDTSSPFGKAMIGILAVFAQLEREQIKERMSMGRDARAKKGKPHGSSKFPIGYVYKDGILQINEAEASQIRMIFDLYTQGKTPTRIAKIMNESGLTHHYGSWTPTTVRHAISKDVYVGNINYKGEIYKGEHEAIIDPETFEKANKLLEQRTKENKKNFIRAGKANSYFGGYIFCAKCGAKYFKTNRYNKQGKHELYSCLSRSKMRPELIKDPNCKNKHWKMDELDNLIFNEIRKLKFEKDKVKKAYRTENLTKKAFELSLKKLNDQINRAIDLYTLQDIPISNLEEKIRELKEQKERLSEELKKVIAEEKNKKSINEMIDVINSFDDVLEHGDLDEIRAVIGALIDKIVIDDENVVIYWQFE